jgi:hypothetical protein
MLGEPERRLDGAADPGELPVSTLFGPGAQSLGSGKMPITETPATATDRNAAVERTCQACAHPWESHDVISTRYCQATIAGALTRGCVCPARD